MKPERRGAKPLAEFMPGIIGETLAARGLGEASLVLNWREIVGEAIARYARPIELQWPPRAAKRDPDARAIGSTLVLRIDGAFALEAQHHAAIIMERVNAHLGWRVVGKIAFRQGQLPPFEPKRRTPPPPEASSEARARQAAVGIEDDGLRQALTRLGAQAIDVSSRRLAAASEAEGK